MKTVLCSENICGNLHQACAWTNKMGLSDCVIHLESSGYNSIIIFRVEEDKAEELKDGYFRLKATR